MEYCVEKKAALVLGTTGLGAEQRAKIEAASRKVPVIYGTTMSVGINVLLNVVGKVVLTLGEAGG